MYSACNVYNQLIETVRAGSQSTAIYNQYAATILNTSHAYIPGKFLYCIANIIIICSWFSLIKHTANIYTQEFNIACMHNAS